jgi:hypothetical protein
MKSIWNWFNRGYKEETVERLYTSGITVTAVIPPVAQHGSYAHHKGIDVYTEPPLGKAISKILAEEWIADQWDYYETHVVDGINVDKRTGLLTSSGATAGQFDMRNITLREDGFSFRFQENNHPAGMPYSQLATFIEVMKGVPIIAVNTAHLKAVAEEEFENE